MLASCVAYTKIMVNYLNFISKSQGHILANDGTFCENS